MRRPVAHLLVWAGLVVLAATVVQPACAWQEPGARQAPGEPPGATAGAAEAAAWQARVQQAQARLRAAPGDVALRRELSGLLLTLGRAEEAERVATEGNAPALANAAGEAAYARGRVQEAEAAFRRALAEGGPEARLARANLGVLLSRRGALAEAHEEWARVRAEVAQLAQPRTADLIAAATAARSLGERDPQLFHEAVRDYEAAARRDAADTRSRLEEASLFLEKYESTDAHELLGEVLKLQPGHPGALVLAARAQQFDGSDDALELVRRALAVAPDLIPARLYHAELLLGLEDYRGAAAEVDRALALNPASLEALAVLAAVRQLSGDQAGVEDARRRALALDPHFSGLFTTAAELAVQHRRYREAADLARQAIALDSSDWKAWAQLGMNQFRLGETAAARTSLERSFRGDPFNIWVKNTLDLLDTYPRYVERGGGRVHLFVQRDEADLLDLYMVPLAEEAFDSLSRRYGYKPTGPIRVEVFPRHADFSVRTVGLTGLGALGVTFGEEIAMDSPAARERGSFNWGSTLWHELAHVFTLGASRNRVPRWLTEGLSVYEERRARPGWGDRLSLSFAQAFNRGQILPVSRLNEGFVRPTYPEQIVHSYLQASLLVEMIERRSGFGAIRRMLAAYGAGQDNEKVIRGTLGLSPADLDTAFTSFIRQRFARQLAAAGSADEQGPYLRQLAEARSLTAAGNTEQARRTLAQARDAFPDLAGPGSAYNLLADLAERAGDRAAAATELERAFAVEATDYDGIRHAAELRFALGDTARAAADLEGAVYVHPYDPALHQQLGEALAALGRFDGVVRERRAAVALKPVDLADARYRLAVALERAGKAGEARMEVMRALEIAPNYAAAQELLLRLSGGAARDAR